MLSKTQFKHIFPNAKKPESIIVACEKQFPLYGIDTDEKKAALLSQMGHESAGYRQFVEYTYYSNPDRIEEIFSAERRKGYSGKDLMKNKRLLANVVYSNRNGNSDIESGDGYRFRGRGPLQLTGRANFEAMKAGTGIDVVSHPELLEKDMMVGITSACWFWKENRLDRFFDGDDVDFTGLTRAINGGTLGLKERKHYYNKILRELRQC